MLPVSMPSFPLSSTRFHKTNDEIQYSTLIIVQEEKNVAILILLHDVLTNQGYVEELNCLLLV